MQVVKHLRRLKGVVLLLEELVEGVHGGVHVLAVCWQWGSEETKTWQS